MRRAELKKSSLKRVDVICSFGAALLVSAPSHGVEVMGTPYVERLNRVFTGVPNQLTLPPEVAAPVNGADDGIGKPPAHIDASSNSLDNPKKHSKEDGDAVETSVQATIGESQTQTGPAPLVRSEHVH
jgi:hypothetical protein